jgi:hypothetical protein
MISRPNWRRLCWLVFLELTVLIVLLSVGLFVTNGFPHGDVYSGGPVVISVIGLAVIVSVFPLLWNLRNGDDPFEPVVILGGIFFLYYPLNAFGIVVLNFGPAFPAFQSNSGRLLAPYTTGLIIIIFGIMAFYAGYYSVRKQATRRLVPTVPSRKPVPMYLLIIWIFSAGVYLSFLLGLAPAGNAFLGVLAGWHHYVPAMFLVLYYHREYNFSRGIIISLVLFEFLILTAVEFQLDQVLVQIIFLIVAYNYAGPGLTYKKLSSISGITVILFPVAVIFERLQSGFSLSDALFFSESSIDGYFQAFVSRFIGTEALTLIVDRTPDAVEYQLGDTLLLTIYSLVPRVIWPEKPSIIMCGLNNIYFSGRGPSAGTCSAMTVPGELYWNFGTIGVVIGLFWLGLLIGLLYRLFIEQISGSTHLSIAIVLYAIALTHFVKIESGIAQMFSSMIKELILAGVLLIIVTTRSSGIRQESSTGTVLERSSIFLFLISILLPISHLLGKTSQAFQSKFEPQWQSSVVRKLAIGTHELGENIAYSLYSTIIRALYGSRIVGWCRRCIEVAKRSHTWRILNAFWNLY